MAIAMLVSHQVHIKFSIIYALIAIETCNCEFIYGVKIHTEAFIMHINFRGGANSIVCQGYHI